MRYTVTITGQLDTPYGAAAIVRDAGWILTEAVPAIVPGTVEVTSVEPVEPVANPAVDAAEFAVRALSLADQRELAARFGVDL
jgi:hypothetical protein